MRCSQESHPQGRDTRTPALPPIAGIWESHASERTTRTAHAQHTAHWLTRPTGEVGQPSPARLGPQGANSLHPRGRSGENPPRVGACWGSRNCGGQREDPGGARRGLSRRPARRESKEEAAVIQPRRA